MYYFQGDRFIPTITEPFLKTVVARTECGNFQITLSDLATLDTGISSEEIQLIKTKCRRTFSRGWLNDSIIDCFVYRIIHKTNYDYFNCTQVESILYPVNKERRVTARPRPKKSDAIFFPVNLKDASGVGHHWTLLVCYPNQHRFEYLDPLFNNAPDLPYFVINNLIQYLAPILQCPKLRSAAGAQPSPTHTCQCGTPWKIDSPTVFKQQDSMSCGVFICHYIQAKISGNSFEKEFEASEFRTVIYDTLLFPR